MIESIIELAMRFSKEPHGASSYDEDLVFIKAGKSDNFVPLSFLKKHIKQVKSAHDLQTEGFLCSSADFVDDDGFSSWYKQQFNKKLTIKQSKAIMLLTAPQFDTVSHEIAKVHESFQNLRELNIINNGKNFPVQVGEWYAKSIFGLYQVKSSSQRGFDFYLNGQTQQRVEVMVHWSDSPSPKGVKLKKSLVELAQYCIIIYVANNFMIREILFLDSSFVLRKFSGKGHTLFLKDKEVFQYFFSQSNKHYDKILSYSCLEKVSTKNFHEKVAEQKKALNS